MNAVGRGKCVNLKHIQNNEAAVKVKLIGHSENETKGKLLCPIQQILADGSQRYGLIRTGFLPVVCTNDKKKKAKVLEITFVVCKTCKTTI